MGNYSIRKAITWIVNNAVVIGLALIFAPLLFVILSIAGIFVEFPSTGTESFVEFAKSEKLPFCPGKTIEEVIVSAIAKPTWVAGSSENTVQFVNVSGDANFDGKVTKAFFQFQFEKSGKSFIGYLVALNDIPQEQQIASEIVTKMCVNESQVSEVQVNSQSPDTPNNSQAPEILSKIYSREEFKLLVLDKTKAEIIELIGKPDRTNEIYGNVTWNYTGKSKDVVTGKIDASALITFNDDISDGVDFY